MLYIQFWAPDDGRRNRRKHVEHFIEINQLCNVASCWLHLKIRSRCADPWTSKISHQFNKGMDLQNAPHTVPYQGKTYQLSKRKWKHRTLKMQCVFAAISLLESLPPPFFFCGVKAIWRFRKISDNPKNTFKMQLHIWILLYGRAFVMIYWNSLSTLHGYLQCK